MRSPRYASFARLLHLLRGFLCRSSFPPPLFRVPLAEVFHSLDGNKPARLIAEFFRDGLWNEAFAKPSENGVIGTLYLRCKFHCGHVFVQLHCSNVRETVSLFKRYLTKRRLASQEKKK